MSRRFCTEATLKHIQVCILGADTPLGRTLSFILKQNPAISGLHLQGSSGVETMALDLDHFDTRSKVRSYFDADSVNTAVKLADIIVLTGANSSPKKTTLGKMVMSEGTKVSKLAEACAKYAPKSIVIVAATPVSVTLPIVAEVYRQTDWYHPARLLGSAALAQIKANALAARYQTLDPQIIHVPIVGGPDLDCAIPLFVDTVPVGISAKDSQNLLKEFRKDASDATMSHAVGLNRMITAIALGMNGDENADVVAFVRTNVISNCKHLVCKVKVKRTGIYHNYGLQKLSRNDLMLLEEISQELKNREEMAHDFVHRPDKATLPKFMLKELEQETSDKMGIIRQ